MVGGEAPQRYWGEGGREKTWHVWEPDDAWEHGWDMLTCRCWGFTMHKRWNCDLGWESPQQIVKLSILDLVLTDYTN